MTTRNVVVAMPFGKPGVERRKAILNFRRLKYIIENKCQVVPTGSGTTGMRVAYDVDVAKTAMDNIAEKALDQIYDADILIALLSERNPTVGYEIGYRRARDRAVINLVDSEDDVPVYELKVAYQDWKQGEVLEHIDDIAGRDFPALAEFGVDIPGELKDVIDAKDDGLIKGLQLALQEIESNFVVLYTDPVQKLRGMLSTKITRFYPFSVVEVRFSKRGEFEDPRAPAKVVEFDEEFSKLYGYGSKDAARGDRPLTLERLLNRLQRYSDDDDWNKFLQEQRTLTETVIQDYGFALATVPIRINSSHTNDRFKCKSFLPCIAAQVIDGKKSLSGGEIVLDEPHQMYLLIAYIEIPNGTAHLSTRGEG
jgi:nucleoside 2-deoxyribosyltransferase